MLFCWEIKNCCDLHTFWKSFGKKMFFWVKNIVSWARMHYYMGYIAHYSVKFANLQLCAKNDAFVAKIANMGKCCQLLPNCSGL